jgi:hypothetical protein
VLRDCQRGAKIAVFLEKESLNSDVKNSTNINKTNKNLSPELIEHK